MQSANPRRWTALAVIALAQFIVIMDTSIIGVALPEIQTDLGFTAVRRGHGAVVGGDRGQSRSGLLLGGAAEAHASHLGPRRILPE